MTLFRSFSKTTVNSRSFMIRSVLLSLMLATIAYGQNPPGYDTAYTAAKNRGVPIVAFVGIPGRAILNAEVLECWTFPHVKGVGVVVGIPNPDGGEYLRYDFPATATDTEIRQHFATKTKAPALVSSGNVREYVSNGIVYREYYTVTEAPVKQAGGTANVAPTPRPPIVYPQAQYAAPYVGPVYSGPAVYSGFNVGGFGGYGSFGANCYGGT
jgi:hypothetical protein